MNFLEYRKFFLDKGYLPSSITWNRLPEYVSGLIQTESYIKNINLDEGILKFEGVNDAFSGNIDLTSLEKANVRAYFGNAAGLTDFTAENLGNGLFWFDGPTASLHYYDYGSSAWRSLTDSSGGGGTVGVDEGNGEGLRLTGFDPSKYANIGSGAVDFTRIANAGSDYGVACENGVSFGVDNKVRAGGGNYGAHVAIGDSNDIAGYYNNTAIGTLNTITNGYSALVAGYNNTISATATVGQNFVYGTNNSSSNHWNYSLGVGLINKSRGTFVAGVANTNYTVAGSAAGRPIFIIGNGVASDNAGNYGTVLSRSDAFTVLENGKVGIGQDDFSSVAESDLLQVAGNTKTKGIRYNLVNITGNYTVQAEDYTIHITSGNSTVTLPTAVGRQGQVFVVKNGGTGNVSIAPNGAETINGGAGTIVAINEAVTVQSEGANWIII